MNMQEHIDLGPEVDKRQMLKRSVRFDEDRCMDDDAGSEVGKNICAGAVRSGDKSNKSHIKRSVDASHDLGSFNESCDVGKICVGKDFDE